MHVWSIFLVLLHHQLKPLLIVSGFVVCSSQFENDFLEYRAEATLARPGPYNELANDPLGSLTLATMATYVPRAILRARIRGAGSKLEPALLLDSWASPKGLIMEQLVRESLYTAIHNLHPLQYDHVERSFYYLPLLQAESKSTVLVAHRRIQELHDESPRVYRPYLSSVVGYAQQHVDALTRFGRYPQRNALMGRASTPEEDEYLRTEYAQATEQMMKTVVGAPDRVWSSTGSVPMDLIASANLQRAELLREQGLTEESVRREALEQEQMELQQLQREQQQREQPTLHQQGHGSVPRGMG